jgi:hypothetical protein
MILFFAVFIAGSPSPQTRGNGFVTGFFKNAEPPCATCNGLGTNTFSWGTPAPGSFQSSPTFLGAQFVNLPQGQPFVAGKMLFRNGGSLTGGLPTYVTLVLQANSPDPAFNHNQEVLIHILNTPGNPNGIVANADWIWIDEAPQYGKWGVAENGFTTVDVLGVVHSLEFAGWGKIDDPRVGFLAATVDPNDFTPAQPAATIAIDVRPGSNDNVNPINLRSKGLLPVALLSNNDPLFQFFDAGQVDIATVTIGAPLLSGRAAPVKSHLEDVDNDGDVDLLFHFGIQDLLAAGAIGGDTRHLWVTASDRTGVARIQGSDIVAIKQ